MRDKKTEKSTSVIDISVGKSEDLDMIVSIHMDAFKGFFLTFLGYGLLKVMYRGYIEYPKSKVLVAKSEGKILGFVAYSWNMSGLYRFLLKKYFLSFAWYGLLGAIRRPTAMLRIIRALNRPVESQRAESYLELTSIAVSPKAESKGIGKSLVCTMLDDVRNLNFSYITLKTDAHNNEYANRFYIKCGFSLHETLSTLEGRVMNEYILEKQNLEVALSSLRNTLKGF